MSNWAEFEEKEFETLANLSLVLAQPGKSVRAYSPGQVLEKELGFDFATRIDPGGSLGRLLFGGTPGYVGITPGQVKPIPANRTTSLLNVFLQYKRPERFPANRHRSLVQARDREFLAFTVRDFDAQAQNRFIQLESMIDLETTLNTYALVKYACPAVWRTQELYSHFSNKTLLANTCFVSPSDLGNPWGNDRHHVRWTFDPNSPGVGIPNPNGKEANALTGVDFLNQIVSQTQLPELKEANVSAALVHTGHAASEVRARSQKEGFKKNQALKEAEASAFLEAENAFSGQEREVLEATIHAALAARETQARWMIFLG